MRTPFAMKIDIGDTAFVRPAKPKVRDIEVTILHPEIDIRTDCVTKAENALPGKPALTVGEANGAVRSIGKWIHLHIRNADADSSIAAKRVLIAKI